MITKERFVGIINYIKEINELTEAINHLYKNCSDELISEFSYTVDMHAYEQIVVELLENMFNDRRDEKYGISNISYFIYDLKYGEKWTETSITESDGTPIPLRTPEELYDYLLNELGEKQDGNN